jgi:hypothetical protein
VLQKSLAVVRRHREAGTLLDENRKIPEHVLSELGDAGYWGLLVDRKHGGTGPSPERQPRAQGVPPGKPSNTPPKQLATKVIARRPLAYEPGVRQVRPTGAYDAPARRLAEGTYDATRVGTWRAFQIAFLLMSLEGCADETGEDWAIVDLIWFPTGDKTEVYLGVAAFLMFHQRLLQSHQGAGELGEIPDR